MVGDKVSSRVRDMDRGRVRVRVRFVASGCILKQLLLSAVLCTVN